MSSSKDLSVLPKWATLVSPFSFFIIRRYRMFFSPTLLNFFLEYIISHIGNHVKHLGGFSETFFHKSVKQNTANYLNDWKNVTNHRKLLRKNVTNLFASLFIADFCHRFSVGTSSRISRSADYNFGYNTINYNAHILAFLLQMQHFLPIYEQFILWKTEKLYTPYRILDFLDGSVL